MDKVMLKELLKVKGNVTIEQLVKVEGFLRYYRNLKKRSRVKKCMHPLKCQCSERIIGAHSIQNNRILKRISTEGNVYMPCVKNKNPFIPISKWGRKQATVFTGFCYHHDSEIFKSIENGSFDKSQKQVFFYIYRCFSIEYHKKLENYNMLCLINKENKMDKREIKENFLGLGLALWDLDKGKKIFDKALVAEEYDIITSVIWEFDKQIKFAASGYQGLEKSLKGKAIQSINEINKNIEHIFISIFPEEKKSYCIIGWFKENDNLFYEYKKELLSLTKKERENYINNILPLITENISINPEGWDKFNEKEKKEFINRIYNGNEFLQGKSSIIEESLYDLFKL